MERQGLENTPGTHVDDLVIRCVVAEDAEAIARLWEKLVEYHHQLDFDLPTAAKNGGDYYAKRIIDRINDRYSRTYVVEDESRVVGFVLGVVTDMTPEMFEPVMGGFLADIYVEDAYRGRGVGRRLVYTLMDWFRSRGVEHFEWHVAENNHAGRQFWQAIGGRPIMHRMRMKL